MPGAEYQNTPDCVLGPFKQRRGVRMPAPDSLLAPSMALRTKLERAAPPDEGAPAGVPRRCGLGLLMPTLLLPLRPPLCLGLPRAAESAPPRGVRENILRGRVERVRLVTEDRVPMPPVANAGTVAGTALSAPRDGAWLTALLRDCTLTTTILLFVSGVGVSAL